jgi:hypothetical protein
VRRQLSVKKLTESNHAKQSGALNVESLQDENIMDDDEDIIYKGFDELY